jgi:phosphomethylpyrimidine synthase
MTRLESAKRGIVSPEILQVAKAEGLDPQNLRREIAAGRVVLVGNSGRLGRPLAIGKGLPVRVNANIGSSDTCGGVAAELEKAEAAIKAGADALMDLSTGRDIREIRRRILEACPVAVGTVPLYEAMAEQSAGGLPMADLSGDQMLEAVSRHVRDGVDFVTVHCGIRQRHLKYLGARSMGVVSRGGSFLAEWMRRRDEENPYFSRFDELLNILKEKDVTLSLGDALRPGAIADAGDRAQYAELGKLVKRARAAGVQTIVEGPGHVPLHQVRAQVRRAKRLCSGAPFYILGPLVTDSAAGYDHIAGAIGGALAAMEGADFLCYLTPREHLGLPELEHVLDGVAASKVAAHAADIARGNQAAIKRDGLMSGARLALDWEGQFAAALFPERARSLFTQAKDGGACSMCGELCSARRAATVATVAKETEK